MPAGGLSESQLAILGELGVDVWQLRPGTPAAVQATELAAAAPDAAEQPRPVAPPPTLPGSWEATRDAIRSCTRCGLHATRKQAVCGVGDTRANWLVVGEAPGADEDAQGEPFVGRAGQLLNQMLRAAGLQRDQVYIANVIKCRPPDNRNPSAAEIAECLPHLERQIELLQPRIILVVGAIAARTLLHADANTPVGKLRGTVHHYGTTQVPLVVTYHPAYLLRKPIEKRKTWADLRLAIGVAAEVAA